MNIIIIIIVVVVVVVVVVILFVRPYNQWRGSVVKMGVRVSQVKPSNCFRRLENQFYLPLLTMTEVFHP